MIRLFLKVNGAVRWESTLSRALEKIDVDKIYMINKEAKTTEAIGVTENSSASRYVAPEKSHSET